MRKADFEKNHDEFEWFLVFYGDLFKRLIEARKVVRTKYEKEELVEALILRCAVRWELLVERDIITSFNRDSSAYACALGLRLRKHLTRDEVEAMVIGHKYLDFKSVEQIKDFGKKYLIESYNPFNAINPKCGDKINEFLTMRNLLSHYSSYAWRAYNKMMKNKYSYTRIPQPGAFLISLDSRTGNYRWAEYLLNFLKCSEDMRKAVS